jgi:hypothetical protein
VLPHNQQEVGVNLVFPHNQREVPIVDQVECLHNQRAEATDLQAIMVLQDLPYRTLPVTGAVADSAVAEGAAEAAEVVAEGAKLTATAH